MAERKDIIKLDEFPSNSHKSKEKKTVKIEEIESKKIIKGNVKRREKKETLGSRVKNEIISTDGKSVLEYLLTDIFIPAAKDLIVDLVRGGVENMVYGGDRSSRDRSRGKSRVSYESYYDRRNDRPRYSNHRSSRVIDDVIFDHRSEADDVLVAMLDEIDDYGIISVGRFYDLVGVKTSPTDFKWGWETLNSAKVVRDRDGFVISFPRPIAID